MNTRQFQASLLSKVATIVAAAIAATIVPACNSPTEIVLVIDTNLTKYDIDQVVISITGSMTQMKVLSVAAAPPFPWTLGLEPGGGSGAVGVSVVASLQGNTVVQQKADTEFVEGEERMLRILLLDSCVGISCPSMSSPQTCTAGACASTDVSGSSLPSWSGSAPASPKPTATVPIGGRTIWANGWHACANEGTLLYCWGQNSDGEVGDGRLINANSRKPVQGLAAPAAVGLGQLATCTCDMLGNAWCWGRNVEGELGIGSASANSTVPVQVPGISDCLQITGGANHTCLVHGDGTVSCWGSNDSGQAGQPTSANGSCSESSGTTVPCIVSPARVAGLTNASQIVAGQEYTCVLKSDMTAACWGDNSVGELGDGTNTSRPTVAAVKNLAADIVELSAGRGYVCARHQTGSISCWGGNPSGQLGNGNTANSSSPVSVAGVTDSLQLATGLQHTCALRSGSRVSCWGGNSDGQLGNGTTTDSLVPVDVIDLKQVNSITAGSVFTCARSPTGAAFCWGEDLVNELGDGATTNQSQPVSVAGFSSM
jgi:alpha-tubulin suppressor-like RCC1 family protein